MIGGLWVNFSIWWEGEEAQINGSKKSQYIILTILYPVLYFLSAAVHEAGHIIGAMITGMTVTNVKIALFGSSVEIITHGMDPTFVALLGGVFQGVFFLALSKWYKPLRVISGACFVYAVVESAGFLPLMVICAFFAEFVGCFLISWYAV